MPRIPLAVGVETALGLVHRSVSTGTWSGYSRVWQDWELLLQDVGPECSDRESCLLYFIGRSFSHGLSHTAMCRSLSALAFWFKVRGERDWTKSFLVRQAARGFRRGTPVRDGRRPVSYDILLRLGISLGERCFSSFEVSLFRLAFSLAFFGAFRISELVSPSRSRCGGLRFEDVFLMGGSLDCYLRQSKTDQVGRGSTVSLHCLAGSDMCPVQLFSEYVFLRGSAPGPLLIHGDGLYLSRFQFTQVFRQCLQDMGLPSREYSSHSFRVGAATEAARWGLSDDIVRRIGRWESNRFQLYVRPHLL